MDNKPSIPIFAILLLCVLLSSCDNKSSSQIDNDWNIVNHEAFDFSIEYPNNLLMFLGNEFGYKGDDYVRFIVSTYRSQIPRNLIITVETRTAENPSLNDVIDWGDEDLDAIKSDLVRVNNSGFEEIFLVEDQIDNALIYRRRYAYRQSGLLFEEVYLARENDMVIMTLSVDEQYFDYSLKIFDQMVDSFKPLD